MIITNLKPINKNTFIKLEHKLWLSPIYAPHMSIFLPQGTWENSALFLPASLFSYLHGSTSYHLHYMFRCAFCITFPPFFSSLCVLNTQSAKMTNWQKHMNVKSGIWWVVSNSFYSEKNITETVKDFFLVYFVKNMRQGSMDLLSCQEIQKVFLCE